MILNVFISSRNSFFSSVLFHPTSLCELFSFLTQQKIQDEFKVRIYNNRKMTFSFQNF